MSKNKKFNHISSTNILSHSKKDSSLFKTKAPVCLSTMLHKLIITLIWRNNQKKKRSPL
jgi:hypothetical protein